MHPQIVYREVQGFHIDLDRLRHECQDAFDRHQMAFQGGNYAGLGLQKKRVKGTIRDAMEGSGEVVKKNEHGEYQLDWNKYNRLHKDTPELFDMDAKTAIAKNNLLERCLDFFSDIGLGPYRGRIVYLLAHSSLPYHVDTVNESWRAHIPVTTAPGNYFEWNDDQVFEQLVMPADGRAWYVRTDVRHSFFNNSDIHRLHVVISLKRKPLEAMSDDIAPIFED